MSGNELRRGAADRDVSLDAAIADLGHRLPALIGAAFAHYCGFAGNAPPTEARACAQHHAACRSALGHVDMLVKLARAVAGGDSPSRPSPEDLDVLIARAEAALEKTAGD